MGRSRLTVYCIPSINCSCENLRPMTMDASTVAAWLHSHPDFFETHPQLLGDLQLPHPHGTHAVSLSERQLGLLREKNRQLEHRLAEMIHYAEQNDNTSAKVHQLTVLLLQSRDLSALAPALRQFMLTQFEVTQTVLRLWGPLTAFDDATLAPIDPTLQSQITQWNAPYRGPAPPADVLAWCEPGSEPLRSFALLPLRGPAGLFGALLLGATNPTRFTPDMGAFYLTRMAELIALTAWGLAQHPL